MATVPNELAAARRSLAEVDRKIETLVDHIEAGHGGPELDQRLAKRRAEKRELTDRVERLERADHGQPAEPTEPWVAGQLRNLSALLLEQTPAAAHALRHLVGGRIVVTEIRQPGRQRYHLQGRFTITTGTVVASLSRVADYSEASEEAVMGDRHEEIVIDFRSSATENPELKRAWDLHQGGYLNKQIAVELNCSRSKVTKLLQTAAQQHGVKLEDGRARRGRLKSDQESPPLYQRSADEVKRLADEGVHFRVIADQLHCSLTLITKAWRFWHTSRGLDAPDGRTRRKSLAHQQVA